MFVVNIDYNQVIFLVLISPMFRRFYTSHRKRLSALLYCVMGWWGSTVVAEPLPRATYTVKYAKNMQNEYSRVRDLYFIRMLELAAQYSDADITLVPTPFKIHVKSRILLSLEEGVLDVHWLHTNEALESQLLPIRVPLYKGLIGWRLMLVRQDDADLLKDVSSLEVLRQFSVLQSFNWPDTPILMASGFQVVPSVDSRNLSRMLLHGRADMFPRSIVEVWGELETQPGLNLRVDSHVVLLYPTAYYFFVAKDNVKLHAALTQGLQRAVDNGEFEKHFQNNFAKHIKKANLPERNLISIDNPNLPALTPLSEKKLWFTPEEVVKP